MRMSDRDQGGIAKSETVFLSPAFSAASKATGTSSGDLHATD
jgi:hypothetical protein